MDWQASLERETGRYEDGVARLSRRQLLRLGNAAYGAGLCLLMLGRPAEASLWLGRATARWREPVAATRAPAWGRPVGALKAALLAGRGDDPADCARWVLALGGAAAASPIGRYAAALAALVLGADAAAAELAAGLRADEEFPRPVADALAALACADPAVLASALVEVLASFEARGAYLEGLPVADTVLVLAALAARRGLPVALPRSPLLPDGP